MKKMYLMKGMAVLAMGLVAASCNKMDFSGQPEISDEEVMENAELALGFEINPNQDWNMTKQVSGSVTVSLGYEPNYTIGIYDKNPLNEKGAHYLAKQTVAEGSTTNFSFIAPKGQSELFVVAYDSKKRLLVDRVQVENDQFVSTVTNKVTGTRSAANTLRRATSTFPFPTAPSNDLFAATDVPEGAILLNRYIEDEVFYIDSSCEGVNQIQAEHKNRDSNIPITIYVKGEVDLTGVNNFYVTSGTTLILLPNAKLKLRSNYHFGQANCVVIIPKTAELINDGYIQTESNVIVYNRGTITCDNYNVTNGSLLYNEGTIDLREKTNGKLRLTNSNSVVVNDGTLKVKQLDLEGTSHIQNNNEFVVTGKTNVNSNDATWVNNGDYTTQYFFYTAGSTDVINNCRMTVTEDFNMNLGDTDRNGFVNDGSVITRNFNGGGNFYGYYAAWYRDKEYNGGPFRVTMGVNSIFKVTGTATMDATKDDYGFVGPTDGWAILEANEIVAGTANQGYEVTYKNNLAVVTNSHFKQGYSGSYPYINWKGNATLYEPGTAPAITVATSGCSQGFTPDENDDDDDDDLDNPQIFSYAFEDTKKGDYDMNDVVLKVSESEDKENFEIKLVAAGATLNLEIRLYDYSDGNYGNEYEVLSYNGKAEIHEMFGVEAGTMVNTGRGASVKDFPVITIAKGTRGNVDPSKLRLAIYSDSQGEMRLAGAGQAPFGVVIPADWKWPKERVCIKNAYNQTNATAEPEDDKDQSFEMYAKKENTTERAKNWYKYPTGSVMDESDILK